jgi:hypothetical protein
MILFILFPSFYIRSARRAFVFFSNNRASPEEDPGLFNLFGLFAFLSYRPWQCGQTGFHALWVFPIQPVFEILANTHPQKVLVDQAAGLNELQALVAVPDMSVHTSDQRHRFLISLFD